MIWHLGCDLSLRIEIATNGTDRTDDTMFFFLGNRVSACHETVVWINVPVSWDVVVLVSKQVSCSNDSKVGRWPIDVDILSDKCR